MTIQAKSADGALMNGVTVTLSGTNNNGTGTMLLRSDGTTCDNTTTAPPSGVTSVIGTSTDVVTINFCVTKTGG